MDLLKVIAMLSAGLFGAIGVLTESKKNGRPTKWGKLALAGIILSTAFSLEIARRQAKAEDAKREVNEQRYIDEVKRQRKIIDDVEVTLVRQKDNLDATKKNLEGSERMAADLTKSVTLETSLVRRTDNLAKTMDVSLKQQGTIASDTARLRRPLKFSGLAADFEYDLNDPNLMAWGKRVRDYVETVTKSPAAASAKYRFGAEQAEDGRLVTVQIPNGSALFPDYRIPGEAEAYGALAYAHISLAVSSQQLGQLGEGAELRYQAAAEFDKSRVHAFIAWISPRFDFQPSVDLEIDLRTAKVRQKLFANELLKKLDTGKDTSFVDLAGKIMQIDLPLDDGRPTLIPTLTSLMLYEDDAFSRTYSLPVTKFTPRTGRKATLVYTIRENDFAETISK